MSIDYQSFLPVGYVEDPTRGPVYEQAPAECDDLTQIHGVGQVLEAQLNLNGVYRLEQIAMWTQPQIEAFGKLMPCFQDRIERNYWILQAQRIIDRRLAAPVGAGVAIVAGGSIEDEYRNDSRPAGTIQTVMVIAIALLIGLLLVQWLDSGPTQRYAGRLNAHTFFAIASTSGTLTDLSVNEGDQVLESQEIGRLIDSDRDAAIRSKNAELVVLSRKLEQARATANLQYEWRSNEIDKEIAEHRRYIIAAMNRGNQFAKPTEGSGQPRVTPRHVPVRNASSSNARNPFIFFSKSQSGSATLIPAVRSEEPNSAFRTPQVDESFDKMTAILLASYEAEGVSHHATPVELAETRIKRLTDFKKSLKLGTERAYGVQSAIAARAKAQEELKTLKLSSNDVTLEAEGFGIVSKCFCKTGDHVRRGQQICELIDCRTQYIAALVPSRQVGAIKPG